MTKIIPILSGRCLVVELPENYTMPEIISNYWRDNRGCDRLRWSCPRPDGGWLKTMQRRLPPGNWRIIGMLNEVTEEQADKMVSKVTLGYWLDYEYPNRRHDHMCATPTESLDSAILAEGYYLDENPIDYPNQLDPKFYDEPYDGTGFYQEIYSSAIEDWQVAQSRVLNRGRCLLLGREGV